MLTEVDEGNGAPPAAPPPQRRRSISHTRGPPPPAVAEGHPPVPSISRVPLQAASSTRQGRQRRAAEPEPGEVRDLWRVCRSGKAIEASQKNWERELAERADEFEELKTL